MVIEACYCGDGFGLAHSHIYENPTLAKLDQVYRPVDSGWVQIWIDWRHLAKNLMQAA